VVGFNLNTADAWAAGAGNLSGIWPTVWDQDVDTPESKAFVANFRKKYGKTPENHAWVEYVSVKILAQAMNAVKSTDTDKLIAYLESGAKFDLLKPRKGYFRAWDHQMMQEAYPFTVKAKGTYKEPWDFLKFGDAVPGPNQSLELLAPTKAQSTCKM
jgi:branched-chain amino acid transport system substrate-binding protein